MQEITMMLFLACLASGGVVMIARKVNPSAFLLSLVLSVLSIGAIVSDEAILAEDGRTMVLMMVAPFVVFVYSIWGMLFYKPRRD